MHHLHLRFTISVVGRIWAGAIYDLNPSYPYLSSGAVILFIIFLLSLAWMGTGKMNMR
jgi:hypothetical protein